MNFSAAEPRDDDDEAVAGQQAGDLIERAVVGGKIRLSLIMSKSYRAIGVRDPWHAVTTDSAGHAIVDMFAPHHFGGRPFT